MTPAEAIEQAHGVHVEAHVDHTLLKSKYKLVDADHHQARAEVHIARAQGDQEAKKEAKADVAETKAV